MSWKKKLAAGTILFGASTLTIHLINKFIYFSSTLDNLLEDSSGLYYNWKFGKIFYTKKGEGSPLLLIHDLTTYSSAFEWNKVIDNLAENNTVYCIDLLGCGRSDKPNLTYTSYLYSQLILDFIKDVIKDKTDIIVTGESSAAAIAACKNDSSMMGQMVLINPIDISLLSQTPTKRTKILSLLINTPVFGTFLYNLLTRKSAIEKTFEMDYYSNPKNVDLSLINTYYEAAHCGNASSKYLFASLSGYYTTMNVSHCLKSLCNNIFIIVGKDNPENIDIAKSYKKILPSIEIFEMNQVKHLPQLEDPEQLTEQIQILFEFE